MRNLKRALSLALASVMLLGMMVVGSSAKGIDDFTDKAEIVNQDAVAVTSAIGMFEGYEDGSFGPENVVTRAEMAVIICTMLYGAGVNVNQFAETNVFTDVPAWAQGYVNLCSSLGIVAGVGDGKFDPNATVTTAQAVLMLCRALGYFQSAADFGSDWMLAATAKGTQLGLYGDLKLTANAGLTRDNVAELVFNALTKAVPVQYNELLGVYYNENQGIIYSLEFNYLQTLGYKNFDLVYKTDTETIYGRPATTWGTGTYNVPTNAGTTQKDKYLTGEGGLIADQVRMLDKDEIITRTGIMYDYKFAYQDETLVWSEYKYHPRWEHGGKMVLASYDLRHKKYHRYPTRQNRYAPFAVEGNWGFVEVDKEDNASIVILDHTFQKEIFRVKGSGDELFVHPSYDGKNNIVTVVVSSKGKHLESIDIHTGKRTPITAFTPYEIDNPVTVNDQIIYRGAFDANNSFYRQTQPQEFGANILNSKFGLRYPIVSPNKDSLLFSFYTSDGYKPGKIAISQLENKIINPQTFRIADSVTRQENWQFELTADSTYASRKYNKTTHLFNFHSWGPIFPDAEDVDIDFGLAVSSQNKLSTLFLTAGFVRGKGYEHGNWQVKATYKGFWPTLQLEFKSGRNDDFMQDYAIKIVQTQEIDTIRTIYKSQRTKGTATVQFPFNISRKNYSRYIIPYVKYEIQAIHSITQRRSYLLDHNRWTSLPSNKPYNSALANPDDVKLQIMRYGLVLNNQTRTSQRDIYPRWGQRLEIGYAHTPFDGLDYGDTKWAEGRLYLPGFWKHHSWTLYFGHQLKSDKTTNYYGNQIYSPRGASLYGYNLSTLKISYALPFWYPDAHIGPLVYMKRFTAEPFFDTGWEKNRYWNKTYHSYGVEISADTHFFRLPFPVNIGFRTGYETKSNSMFVDMLFSVAFTI